MITFATLLACAILSQMVTANEMAIANEPASEMALAEHGELSLVTRYAGMGYNILKANPEGDFYLGGTDPGIKTTRFIFNFTYADGKEAFYKDKMMLVPDQVTFHMSESCAKSHTSDAYSGQTSYKHELSVNVEASGTYMTM